MRSQSINHILPTITTVGDLAKRAGELTLTYFRSQHKIADKGWELGIVTEADLASEKFLKDAILTQFPEHAILAEESGMRECESRENSVIWIIDPLDGTTNFSKGNPYYCVSIGVGVRAGTFCVMELAAISHPFSGDLYTAQRGKGAFLNGVPLGVSLLEDLASVSCATGFAGNKNARLAHVLRIIEIFQNNILGVRVNGAAALDLCNTARGMFQGFFERNLSSWDLAAGSLILEEAGAKVTDMEGNQFDTLRCRDILAANPALHQKMLNLINLAGPWPG